jgi:hypothetical protein
MVLFLGLWFRTFELPLYTGSHKYETPEIPPKSSVSVAN